MCSVVGCDSGLRSVQRFKLPEDPERRLEWVQFLFEVNGQRLKESSWTDITICSEHFIHDCFENMFSTTGTVQLKSDAVPSLCIKSEPEEDPEKPHVEEPVEKTDVTDQCDDLDTCNSPTSYSGETQHILTGSKASPASSDVSVSHSPDVSSSVTSGTDQTQQKATIDLNIQEAELLQVKGKVVVNESCLLQLFRRKCPSCGCKLRMEKLTYGVLIIFNQQCLQCDYRYQWKSQVNASIPTAERQPLTADTETQQEMPTDDNPSGAVFSEIVTFSDENSDPEDEDEEDDDGGESSDGDWNPTGDFLLAEELRKEFEETETEDEGEEEADFASPGGLRINELCTECGRFFNILKPHTCEHKIKPYSCNVCGKRCVTKMSLRIHSKIHDETYEHPCKYCHTTFKTRVDKCKHEQIHQDNKDPYMCPDCPETFATNKERGIHLANHRASREFKCGVCGIDFKDVHHLQRHSVVHTGLKPYKCSVCQRGFNQASHLKSHMRLHTGERPYKCPHCDYSFNHNVSLKSHVQRHHISRSGRQWKKENKRASNTVDVEDNMNKKGTDFDSVEEEGDPEEKVHKERRDLPKNKRSTGRPRGRPKTNAAGNLFRKKGRRSKNGKSKVQRFKEMASSDEESEDERSDSEIRFDSAAAEEADETKTARRNTGRSRGRPKNNSDSDLDKEEGTKKKKYSIQSSHKSSGRGRGRPKKNRTV